MATREDHLWRLHVRFGWANTQLGYAETDAQNAYVAYLAADYPLAINYLCQSCGNLVDCVEYLIDYGYPSGGLYSIQAFLDQHTGAGEEYEFTLVKFIAAYIDAEDDHRSAHRLLMDAYKASMYDKPFDMEYHQNWVRRFLSWR